MWDFIVKWWMEALFTGLTALIAKSLHAWQKSEKERIRLKRLEEEAHRAEFKKLSSEVRQISDSHKIILKDRLYQSYRYHLKEGFCGLQEKEIIAEMYKEYKTLGGNGIIDGIMGIVLSLPTEECK